ncbi:glycosyltransferase family 2 protein [Pseudonocardia spirodelae]|uniref:Glycosyltransferase family 2 protein n=1 Tax=Pseudonocardia spirodelae TaxID=3133431 RepID=A0ABU8T485_9PSEU
MTLNILLPFYGDARLLRLAVESVRAQHDPAWELLVVDDAYPDPSACSWISDVGDPRIRVLRNETNQGANANYRRCLSHVTHDWFTVMGADDVMAPDYLDVVKEAIAAAPDAGIVQPGVTVIDEHGRDVVPLADRIKAYYRPRHRGRTELRGEELATSLLRANWTYFPSLCWRRSALPEHGFRRGLDVVQDLAMILDVVGAGWSMVLDDRPCFRYRRHTGSDSAVRALDGTRFAEERAFFASTAREMDERGWHRAGRAARRHLTSRLNAASLMPVALRTGRSSDLRALSRHLVG